MDISKDIADYVAQTSGLEPDALASFVNEDGSFSEKAADVLKQGLEGFQSKLKSIETDHASKFQEKWDKKWQENQAKILDKREKELREKLKIDEDVRGEDLDKKIQALLKQAASKKGGEGPLDPNDIERSEFFQKKLEAWTKEKEEAVNSLKSEYDQFKAEIQAKETFAGVWGQAVPMIEALKPKFDQDSETVRNDQWSRIQEKLKAFGFEVQEGRILVLDKEGKVAKDANGNNIAFQGLVENIVKSTVGVMASQKREGAGADKGGDGTGGDSGWKGDYPKSEAEYNAIMFDQKYPLDQRLALQKWWQEKGSKAA